MYKYGNPRQIKLQKKSRKKKIMENILPSLDDASLSLHRGNIHFAIKIQIAKTKPCEFVLHKCIEFVCTYIIYTSVFRQGIVTLSVGLERKTKLHYFC